MCRNCQICTILFVCTVSRFVPVAISCHRFRSMVTPAYRGRMNLEEAHEFARKGDPVCRRTHAMFTCRRHGRTAQELPKESVGAPSPASRMQELPFGLRVNRCGVRCHKRIYHCRAEACLRRPDIGTVLYAPGNSSRDCTHITLPPGYRYSGEDIRIYPAWKEASPNTTQTTLTHRSEARPILIAIKWLGSFSQ